MGLGAGAAPPAAVHRGGHVLRERSVQSALAAAGCPRHQPVRAAAWGHSQVLAGWTGDSHALPGLHHQPPTCRFFPLLSTLPCLPLLQTQRPVHADGGSPECGSHRPHTRLPCAGASRHASAGAAGALHGRSPPGELRLGTALLREAARRLGTVSGWAAVLREAGAVQLLAASPVAPHVGSGGRLDKLACLLLPLGNQVILTAVGTGVTTDGLATQPVKQAAYR